MRPFGGADAPMVLELLNDPAWIRYIGDRQVRTLDDARRYIERGPMESYAKHGYGLDLVERLSDGEPLGMCGLVRRDTLPGPDIGFAFLSRHRGHGYALEAARATLDHAHGRLGFPRILAIVTPGNAPSERLLAKLGFRLESSMPWKGDAKDPVNVYVHTPGGLP